ncbi:MAG: T9SS type A sorting domain-containing protein, partial [Candidatus Paceibacterota bacterium]
IGLDLSSFPNQNVYGVIFTIEYDSNFVVANTMNTEGVTTWFGTENTNYIQRNVDDYPQAKMDVGLVGIDKLNRNGGGILIDGIWTMEDVVIPIAQGYLDMPFKISNVFIIDYEQNVIDACGVDTVIRVYDKSVGIFEREELTLTLYPNPTNASAINIEHIADLEFVEMYDLNGRRVSLWKDNFNQLPIGEFNKGVYILKAYTADKVYLNKLVYNKE